MTDDLAPRALAVDLLSAVLRRQRPLDDVFEARIAGSRLEGRDRGFVRLLVAATLRRLGQIDALIGAMLDRPGTLKPPIQDLLRLGVAQLLFLGTPAHAAVNTTVALTGAEPQTQPYKKLVNALMRRLGREGAALLAAQDAARLNTPDWLWNSWQDAYGAAGARAIAGAHLHEAPLDLSLKIPADATLWAGRLEADILPTGSLRRAAGGAVTELPGFAEGGWWVQDAAAALPARLLGAVAAQRVFDLCAAPGGKTAQLAAAGARVVAVDRAEPRLARLSANLARLGLDAETVTADAAGWQPAEPADAILLDAPCSATGTIRRHPDIPQLKQPADVAKLAVLQARLLGHALTLLRPGGTLVYTVCSLQPEEGERQIAALLSAGAPAARKPVSAAEIGGLADALTTAGDVRTLPCHLAGQGGMDGFYIARLVRTGG
ncbi:MAG: transcription antitermination factor NusB [Rhodospirillaceae bacterium]